MANVKLVKVKKVYDKNVTAVQAFDLEVADKEFIVLVGPSGCGKSTTLRMIAGLEEMTSGELYIGDKLMNNILPKDRDIAMVFQNYALYPHMTVYDNLGFALKIRKEKKDVIDKKVKEAAEILGITDLLDRKPKALSGGQRQRVAIGRAIVRNPKVFLMDEPLSNLDAKLRNQMRTEIIKLRKRIDTTFIYVTHDQTEAMTLGDRIVIMKDGFIQQIGSPGDVFQHPANLFVAGFIGTPQMNFFPAALKKDRNAYSIVLNDDIMELPQKLTEMLEGKNVSSCEAILGIRPEYLQIEKEVTKSMVPATVDVSEMMGSEVYIHVNMLNQDSIIRVPTTAVDTSSLRYGAELNVAFDWNQVHLFDKETEKNILMS